MHVASTASIHVIVVPGEKLQMHVENMALSYNDMNMCSINHTRLLLAFFACTTESIRA